MNFDRKSGVLLHVTSLPGRWGMGELGPHARAFGDFLAEGGQSLWQILPAGPVGFGSSPYSALSAFAGNHLLISFDELLEVGLLSPRQVTHFPEFDVHRIDFLAVIKAREAVLFRVADRFTPDAAFEDFCIREEGWLADYALFMALREAHGFRSWTEWPAGLRDRDPHTLEEARRKLFKRIQRHQVLQYLFFSHWRKWTSHLQGLGISLVGDIPIFVAGDSADVWAHRELFFLDAQGHSTVVAGVPPDYFSATGQRWGNPLYDWEAHRRSGYAWWTQRMRHSLEMTGMLRIDHFRGFEDYWEIPADEPTAVKGRWVKGPGLELFQTIETGLRCGTKGIPGLGKTFCLSRRVIAENLGLITDDVERLREACGFPGMWVLHFRFGSEELSREGYRPEGVEKNWAVYPGTHDNDTTESWFRGLDPVDRERVGELLQINGRPVHRALCERALQASARLAVLPMQDVLGLGGEARMNTPGTTEGNWCWRFSEDMITQETLEWLRRVTAAAGRGG